MAEDKFKLPGSSYEELIKIITAYGNTSGPVAPSDVGSVIGIHETIVSRNNGFLLATGIVEGGNRKATTELGRSLARALEHEVADDIRAYWRQVVDQTEFLQRLVTAVRIRRGMEMSTLQAHVAYTAGQPRQPRVMTGAATVIEILRQAGVLQQDDGRLTVGTEALESSKAGEAEAPTRPEDVEDRVAAVSRRPEKTEAARVPAVGFNLELRVEIQASVSELPELAANLRGLREALDALREPSADHDVD